MTDAIAAEQNKVYLHKQVQELYEQMNQTQRDYEIQIDSLEQRILELEQITGPYLADNLSSVAGVDDPDEYHSMLQWSMSSLMTVGGSSASSDELLQLQGGSHDPRKNGFTIQALAFAARARLDHHFDAMASIVSHIEPDGESVVELEQAFIHGKDLPYELSMMAGQYFLHFGEANTQHPDDWDFVDAPFLLTRLFGGDKLRSQGIQFTWQLPLPKRSTLLLAASNPNGETVTSFLYKEGKEVAGHVLQARDIKGPGDLLYLFKWSQQITDNNNPHRIGFGASALFGPNATGDSTDTQIVGLNFDWGWYGGGQSRMPRFNWRTEWMFRRYEAGDKTELAHEILNDYGIFSQAVWQLDSGWAYGLRAEFADGNKGNVHDPLRDNRKRFSINVAGPFSKSVNWRLQYNRDLDDNLQGNSADSVWFQIVFRAGAHEEHK